MDGKLQFHSHLTLIAQVLVPCWIQFYLPLEKTIQWCLGSSSFFLIIDDMVVLDCILKGCCKLRGPFYVWVLCLLKDNLLAISCIVNLFCSSVTSSSSGLSWSFLWVTNSIRSSLVSSSYWAARRSVKSSSCRSSSSFSLRVIKLLKISLDSSSPSQIQENGRQTVGKGSSKPHSWWGL